MISAFGTDSTFTMCNLVEILSLHYGILSKRLCKVIKRDFVIHESDFVLLFLEE